MTDDTAALQAALSKGNVTLEPSQTVLITNTITIPAYRTFNGQGATILCGMSGDDSLAFLLTGANNTTFKNLILDGNDACLTGCLAVGADDLTFDTVTFQNFIHLGWRTSAESHRIICQNCTFTNIRGPYLDPVLAISPSYCFDTVITRCTFENIGEKQNDWAIYDSGTSGAMEISYNTITNCDGGGIKVHTKNEVMDERVIAYNTILNVDKHGMSLTLLGNMLVTNNTVQSAKRGIETYECGGEIADNDIYCSAEIGYYAASLTSNLAIRRNNILAVDETAPLWGVYLGPNIHDVTIEDNVISGYQFGIASVPDPFTRVTLQGNTITGAETYAIRLYGGSDITIEGNTADTHTFVRLQNTSGALITANILNPPMSLMALFEGVDGVYIWDNIDNVGGLGIYPDSTGEWYEEAPPA